MSDSEKVFLVVALVGGGRYAEAVALASAVPELLPRFLAKLREDHGTQVTHRFLRVHLAFTRDALAALKTISELRPTASAQPSA